MDPAPEGLRGCNGRWKGEAIMPYADPEAAKAYRKARVRDPEKERERDRRRYAANPEKKCEEVRKYREAHPEKMAVRTAAYRPRRMALRPELYRKAYDPNCRPFPATLDLASGEWVRCERTLLSAPGSSLAARVAAALIVIEERLAEEEMAA
jgi:hypothetical protein